MKELNREQVIKALVTSSGGTMAAGDFEQFFGDVVNAQPILSVFNVRKMTKPIMNAHSFAPTSRLLRVADTTNGYAQATLTAQKRQLIPVRCGSAIDVEYDQLDDMISGGAEAAEQTLRNHIAKLIAADIVDLAGNGDGSTAGFLNVNEGFPVLAAGDSDVNDYDETNTTFLGASGILEKMAAQQPEQYLEESAYFMARSEYEKFLSELGARGTQLGDEATKRGGSYPHHGHQVYGVYGWPVDKIIFTPPANLLIGMWKEISIKTRDMPDYSKIRLVPEIRIDFQHAVGEAIVYGTTD